MSKISFVKEILDFIPKARKYYKAPEGMEIFHSTNPFVGDKLVLNGTKLANGPRTLMRELKSFGYESKEAKRLIGQCETAPELYPQMSAMLKGISSETMQMSGSKDVIMRNMNELAEYCIKNPQSITDIKDWGHLFNTMCKGIYSLRLDNFLKNNVTDFKTAEKLFKSVQKTIYNNETSDIPLIIKESKLPKEQLTRIFDNQLKLANDDAAYQLCQCDFRKKILTELNKNPENAKHFSDLLEKLTKSEGLNKKFDVSETFVISKHLKEEWQIDFIKNFKDKLYNLGHIKTPEQGQIAIELNNKGKYREIREFYEAIDKEALNTKEATEGYKYLLEFKMNNGIKSDSMNRFTGIAREDICQLVQNKQDLEILKLMAAKKNVRGEDLYDTFSIIKVLEQSPEKKAKIAEKLRKEYTFNKEAIESAHLKVIEKYNTTNRCGKMRVAALYGRIAENERQFQQTVRQIPAGLKEAEVLKQIAPGEVVEIGAKLVVSDGTKLAELEMDKDMFKKLFVTNEYLVQGLLGDCGCVSTIDGLLSTPKGKSAIYQLFEQVGNDIYINLKGYKKKIKFENAEFCQHVGLMEGAKGIKMLEQALAIAHIKTKQCEKSVITAYKDLIKENRSFNNIMSSLYSVDPYYVISRIVDKFESNTKCTIITHPHELKNIGFSNNQFAILGVPRNAPGSPKWHMSNYHFHNTKKLDNHGKFNVTNPWDTSFATKVPAYEILQPDYLDWLIHIELI